MTRGRPTDPTAPTQTRVAPGATPPLDWQQIFTLGRAGVRSCWMVRLAAARTRALLSPVARWHTLDVVTQLALLLVGHFLLWTWIGWSSRSNFDAPGDMAEAYVWSQGWQWGYHKHPPLSAWVVGLWFSVVPESHLGYSALSAFNTVVGLAGLAVLAREFLPRHWVLLCVAAASLTPGITTLAMRFNANAVLVATWPWAMALFVRLMRHNRRGDALLCGLACALALLGKYYSGVLLCTLVATSLLVPAWRRRWLEAPAWLALLAFGIAMLPHGLWLLAQAHGPLQYAAKASLHEGHGASAMRALNFALAQWVFPAVAFLLLWLALTGPARGKAWWQAVTGVVRPRWGAPWLLAMVPIIATMLGTLLTQARTATVWGLPISAGIMLLAAARAREAGAGVDPARIWRVIGTVWLVAALMSPVWWLARARLQLPGVAEPRQELALALDALWRRETGEPLRWVSGSQTIATSASFYLAGGAGYWSLSNAAVETPWVDMVEVQQVGGVIVCNPDDPGCARAAEAWSAERRTLAVAKHERGMAFAPVTYTVFLMRPSAPQVFVP